MQMEKTRDRMLRAMFVALIAAGAFIRIPVPVVPFTLQYLFTMLAGLLLGGRKGGEAVRLCARRVQPTVSDVPLRHGALHYHRGSAGTGAEYHEGVVCGVLTIEKCALGAHSRRSAAAPAAIFLCAERVSLRSILI